MTIDTQWVVQFRWREGSMYRDDMPMEWTTVSEYWYAGSSNGHTKMKPRSLTTVVKAVTTNPSMADFYVFRVYNLDTQESIPVDVLK